MSETRTRIRTPAIAPLDPVAPGEVLTDSLDATVATGDTKTPTLASVMASVNKLHGPATMRRADVAFNTFKHIPTGVFVLDMALFGGIPQSLINMVYGWESSGKTTISMRVLGRAQQMFPDKKPVFIDAEGTFDPAWARRHGVDPEQLLLVQPETGEQAVDIADAVIRAQDTSLLIVDSLPALMPVKELEKSAEDSVVAMQARLIGLLVRKLTQGLLDMRKKGYVPSVLLINQWRSKIAMMGDTRSLPGGNALKFFASTRFEVKNKEQMGVDAYGVETVDHNDHAFVVTKNKIGTGMRTGEFTMIRNPSHARGPGFIDDGKVVLTYGKKFGLFSGGGKSWHIDGVETRFGLISEAVEYLYDHPDFFEAYKRRLISQQRYNCGIPAQGWI